MPRSLSRNSPFSLAATAMAMAMLLAFVCPAAAITVGMVDDFDDNSSANSVLGWGGSATSRLADSGPLGAGDHSLHIESGNRVTTFNASQWKGNYAAAGITKIAMDVQNRNDFVMQLRLAIAKGPFDSQGAGDTYVTNYSLSIPNDVAWHRVTFDVAAANFAPSLGNNNPSPSAAVALTDVTHLRIMHSLTAGDFRGASGGALWQLDNITAIGVPEPTGLAMLGVGGLALSMVRRKNTGCENG